MSDGEKKKPHRREKTEYLSDKNHPQPTVQPLFPALALPTVLQSVTKHQQVQHGPVPELNKTNYALNEGTRRQW